MTVEVDSGPGAGLYQSTRFTATVNASASHVYGYTRTTVFKSTVWNNGDSVEASWITFGSNQTTAVVITRIAGAITSYAIYPGNVSVSPTLAAGKLTLQVPANTRLRVELNGDRKHVLLIMSSPLKATVPAARTDWTTLTPATVSSVDTGTNVITTTGAHGYADNQRIHIWTTATFPAVVGDPLDSLEVYFVRLVDATHLALRRTSGGADIDLTSAGSGTITFTTAQWTDTGNALYFPAGVHTIGRQFYVATNTHVYLDRGAVVIGALWSSNQTGITVDGAGVLSGAFSLWELAVAETSFFEQIKYAMFHGSAEAPFIGHSTTVVRGITTVASPWFGSFRFATEWTNVHFITPWTWNSDGGDVIRNDDTADSTGLVDSCLFVVGDDCFKANGAAYAPAFSTIRNSLFVPTGSSALHNGYYRELWNTGEEHYVHAASWENCDVVQIAAGDIESGESTYTVGQTCIVKCMVSCRKEKSRDGRQGVSVTDLRVWGPVHGRPFYVSVEQYPYSDPGADPNTGEYGQIADINFDGVSFETDPLQLGMIDAVRWWNAPHDINFLNVEFADARLTTRTAVDYLDVDPRAYRIFMEGTPLVTNIQLCNSALSHLGQRAVVTAIAPPDGSAESVLCATFYDQCVNALLEMRNWGFATTRIALTPMDPSEDSDIDGWLYAYQVPAGMLRALAILLPGATDDYVTGGVKQPQDFAIETHSSGDLAIYCNVEDAVLRYTTYVTDPNFFSPLFQKALTWLLASEIAGPLLKGDAGQAAAIRAINMANGYMAQAAGSDGMQRQVSSEAAPRSIAAR